MKRNVSITENANGERSDRALAPRLSALFSGVTALGDDFPMSK